VLVVAEIALSLPLLSAAGLMVSSFAHLRGEQLGFRPDRLLTVTVLLNDRQYGPSPSKRGAFFQQALERIEALPGVESAGMTGYLPLQGGWIADFSIESRKLPPAERPMAYHNVISPGYFRSMGIPLLHGRDFQAGDGVERPVAIIDETLAQRFWPGQDPVGQRIVPKLGDWKVGAASIVGVVADVKQTGWGAGGWGLAESKIPQIYTPHHQDPWTGMSIVVRTRGNPMDLAKSVQEQIWSLDREQPITELQTMDDRISDSLARPRFYMFLPAVFAGMALVLAAVGIYGVISYSVSLRTHEIGVRMSIGAQPRDVMIMVLRQGMGLSACGLALGLAGSLGAGRLLRSLLYGVSATDPVVYSAVTLLLALVALAACYQPARRAARAVPLVALRHE